MQVAEPFFVTGLPRSKTAWMAAITTTIYALCHHGALSRISSLEDLRGLWASELYRYVGISDPSLGFFLSWILEEIKPRTLIIDRDIDACKRSLEKAGLPPSNYCDLLREELDKWRNHPLVMCVRFEELADPDVMERVWAHLMPNHPFDRDRFEQMVHLNIQNTEALTASIAPERLSAVAKLMAPISERLQLQHAGTSVSLPGRGATMDEIKTIQREVSKLPQMELETRHYFANGMYCRQMTIPAGSLIVGKKHKHEHFFMVMSGRMAVVDEGAKRILETGDVVVAPPGAKRVLFALEKTIGINVHRTDKTDLDEIEEELIEPEAESLFDARNHLKVGGLTCS